MIVLMYVARIPKTPIQPASSDTTDASVIVKTELHSILPGKGTENALGFCGLCDECRWLAALSARLVVAYAEQPKGLLLLGA